MQRFSNIDLELIKRTKKNDLQGVQEFIKQGANINARDGVCKTALYYAIENNKVEMVKLLADNGIDVNKISDNFTNKFALIKAVEKGNFEIVRLLVKKGAAVNLPDMYYFPQECKVGMAPLIEAITRGHIEIAMFLIDWGADVNCYTEWTSPLVAAIEKGNIQLISRIIEMGADVNLEVRPCLSGRLTKIPIFSALYRINQEFLRKSIVNDDILKILIRHGVDLRKKITGIFSIGENLITKRKNINAIEYFLEAGVRYGCDIEQRYLSIVKTLLDGGAEPRTKVQKEQLQKLMMQRLVSLIVKRKDKIYDLNIKNYNKAIELDPKYAIDYDLKGECKLLIKDYNIAIKLNPQDAVAYFKRANIYYSKSMYNVAIKNYNKVIEFKPQHAEAYKKCGNAYAFKRQYELAVKNYNKAIEFKPQDADAYKKRGDAYNSNGQYDLAIKDYDKTIELKPKFTHVYFNRGDAYHSKGLYDLAIEDYNKEIEYNPKFKKSYLRKAISCQEAGRKIDAIQAYNLFLQYASPSDHNFERVELLLLYLEGNF